MCIYFYPTLLEPRPILVNARVTTRKHETQKNRLDRTESIVKGYKVANAQTTTGIELCTRLPHELCGSVDARRK